jgi:hypothetical protein
MKDFDDIKMHGTTVKMKATFYSRKVHFCCLSRGKIRQYIFSSVLIHVTIYVTIIHYLMTIGFRVLNALDFSRFEE